MFFPDWFVFLILNYEIVLVAGGALLAWGAWLLVRRMRRNWQNLK